LLGQKSAIRPGSIFNRQGGSVFNQRQHPHIPKVFELVSSGRCDPLMVSPTVISPDEATEALLQPLAKCIMVRECII